MTGTKVSLTLEAGTAWITLDGPSDVVTRTQPKES